MTQLAFCALCGEPCDPTDGHTFQRVRGWERMGRYAGRQGGGSDITKRERMQEWAHPECVTKLKLGMDARQQALL